MSLQCWSLILTIPGYTAHKDVAEKLKQLFNSSEDSYGFIPGKPFGMCMKLEMAVFAAPRSSQRPAERYFLAEFLDPWANSTEDEKFVRRFYVEKRKMREIFQDVQLVIWGCWKSLWLGLELLLLFLRYHLFGHSVDIYWDWDYNGLRRCLFQLAYYRIVLDYLEQMKLRKTLLFYNRCCFFNARCWILDGNLRVLSTGCRTTICNLGGWVW